MFNIPCVKQMPGSESLEKVFSIPVSLDRNAFVLV